MSIMVIYTENIYSIGSETNGTNEMIYKELEGKADLKDKKCGLEDVEAAAEKGFDQGEGHLSFCWGVIMPSSGGKN